MWHIGTRRYVLVIGNLVLKFPRINFIYLIKDIKRFGFSKLGRRYAWEDITEGIVENFREARCFLRTNHPLLATLYVPALLVNVYRRECGVGDFRISGEELYQQAWDNKDYKFAKKLNPCSHTFDRRDNFAYSKGRVKILDYGERGFEALLINHGDKVERFLLSVARRT